jgi:hypothetical protein
MGEVEVAALLNSNRERLLELPGVIGLGVGRAPAPHKKRAVIHIYVMPDADAESVLRAAEQMVSGAHIEVTSIAPPEAQAN